MVENNLCYRIDTGDDRRISKDEFTSDALKGLLEKVTIITKTSYSIQYPFKVKISEQTNSGHCLIHSDKNFFVL